MLKRKSRGFVSTGFGNSALWTLLMAGAGAFAAASASATGAATASPSPSPSATPKKWVTAYYTGYNSHLLPIAKIDFQSMTHIVVFTIGPNSDGSIKTTFSVSGTNAGGAAWAKSIATAAHAHGVKALVTVGGGGICTWPTQTSGLATLTHNLVKFVNDNGFDGIDVDQECDKYPDLLDDLVAELRTAKPDLILTAAVGFLNMNYEHPNAKIAHTATMLDQVNLMTYGMSGSWTHWVSWHSSPLLGEGLHNPVDIQSSLLAYVKAGVPASKLGLGVGFYGQCWGAPISAPLQTLSASNPVKGGDNTLSITNITNDYVPLMKKVYDTTARVPYLTSPTNVGPAGCGFLSYEDTLSISIKGSFAKIRGYGGTIVWNLPEGYNPKAANPNLMIQTVRDAFMK